MAAINGITVYNLINCSEQFLLHSYPTSKKFLMKPPPVDGSLPMHATNIGKMENGEFFSYLFVFNF